MTPPRLRYEPAFDGLRGLAVLAVMGYHGLVSPLRGGFVGVDIFFVLSGYLITALLLAEHADNGRVAIGAFYGRRARRLLPALFLLLVGIAFYSEFVAFSGDRGAIRSDALSSLLYVQNWHLAWSGASYFTAFEAPSPLRHLWSLAIEEQFYLVWPVVLVLLLRGATPRRRWLLPAAIALAAIASAVLMAAKYHVGSDPSRVYYGTDTRAQELLVGALLATLLSRARPPSARRAVGRAVTIASYAGAAALVWVMNRTADTSNWLYRGGFFAIAIATAAVIAGVTYAPRGWLHRVLSVAPLRAVGRISYGLYLWHWPVFLWLDPDRTGLDGSVLLILRVATTFAIATLSFVFVERPVRFATTSWWRGRRLTIVGVVSVVVILIAVSVPDMSAPARVDLAALDVGVPTTAVLPGPTFHTTTPAIRNLFANILIKRNGWAPSDRVLQADGTPLADGADFVAGLDTTDGRPHIVMVGDSTLLTLLSTFDPGPHSRADYYTYAQRGCGFLPGVPVGDGLGPVFGVCASVAERWKLLVERRRPDLSFLLLGSWEVFDHEIDGQRYRVGTPAYAAKLRAALRDEVDLFSSRGGLVALPLVPCFDPPDFGVAGARDGFSARRDPRRLAAVNAVVREVARERPKVVRLVDLQSFICPHGTPRKVMLGVQIRKDGVHFTHGGSRIVSRWLAPRLEALIPAGPVFASLTAK